MIKTKSTHIIEFSNNLRQYQLKNPDELCPPSTDAQLVVNCLIDLFLGEKWYTTLPVSTKQVNTIALDNILRKYSKQYNILIKNKRV